MTFNLYNNGKNRMEQFNVFATNRQCTESLKSWAAKKDNTLRMTSCKGRLFNLEVAADRKQIAPHTCIAGLQKTENGSGCRRKTWKLDRKFMGLVCKSASQQIEKE